jgi:cellulose synthase/poly-beta-1,6-N-acetylglucosamine synthase-like glycosyltransferase
MSNENFIRFLLNSFFEFYNSIGDLVYYFYFTYSRIILDFIHIFFDSGFKFFIYITSFLAFFYLFMAILVFFKKPKKEIILEKGTEPTVTVQIPTYNELAALNCAKKCIEFDYPKEKMQIIIGDDSSDSSISKRIDDFALKYKDLIVVTRRGKNIGYKPGNLNHMLKYTNGEILVIFDSDFLPDKDFLRRIVAPFNKYKNVSVVQAKWNIANFNQNIYSILGGTISLLCHNIALKFMTWYNGNSFLCGSAEAIRVKDLKDVGGWKSGALTEDIECSLRLMKKGKKLLYLENLECKCEAPYTFRDLCKQQMRWAHGVISSFKFHFIDVMKSKKTLFSDKVSIIIFASGYFFSFLLFVITIFGFLAFISNKPAPIDWGLFLSKTSFNIVITSGFLIASIVALSLGKKLKQAPKMLLGSLSVGLVVTYNVNVGILKAIFGRDVHWFMLNKNGNKLK